MEIGSISSLENFNPTGSMCEIMRPTVNRHFSPVAEVTSLWLSTMELFGFSGYVSFVWKSFLCDVCCVSISQSIARSEDEGSNFLWGPDKRGLCSRPTFPGKLFCGLGHRIYQMQGCLKWQQRTGPLFGVFGRRAIRHRGLFLKERLVEVNWSIEFTLRSVLHRVQRVLEPLLQLLPRLQNVKLEQAYLATGNPPAERGLPW